MYPARVRNRAIALYDAGLSSRAVRERLVKETGSSPSAQTTHRWVRQLGKNRRQHGRRLPLSGEALRPLYEAGMSVDEIAARFGVGHTTVRKRLGEAGTEIYPSGTRFGRVLTYERLRTLYVEKGLTAQRIAETFGCSTGTTYNWLKRRGLPLRGKSGTIGARSIAFHGTRTGNPSTCGPLNVEGFARPWRAKATA